VDAYNSLYDDVDGASRRVILNLVGDDKLCINMKQVQKQHGNNDCGWFAIAFVISLARKVDPANYHLFFDQSQMRSHLINYLQEQTFAPFHQVP